MVTFGGDYKEEENGEAEGTDASDSTYRFSIMCIYMVLGW